MAKLALCLPLLLVFGCVEVPQEATNHGPGGADGPMAGPGPQGGSGPGGAPPAGSGPKRQQPQGFQVEQGQGVVISGTVVYEGEAEGVLRVDFLPPKPAEGMPGAVHSVTMEDGPGAWSVEAPADYGELTICAFIDTNEDGPSRGEPKVLLEDPLVVGSEPIVDVELVVQDDFDRTHRRSEPKQMPPEMRGDGKDKPQPAQDQPPPASGPGAAEAHAE